MNTTLFIDRVLEVLNEADTSIQGAEMVGADENNLSVYIQNQLPAAWRRAVGIFPQNWFNASSFLTELIKIVNATDGTGYVLLPTDYLRLYSFRMKGWKQDVINAPEATPEINKRQANEFIRGNVHQPVCVLRYVSYSNALRKALYYYSLPKTSNASTHIVENALYIPNITTISSNIPVTDEGLIPLVYLTAATVLSSLGKEENAKAIESKIPEMIL